MLISCASPTASIQKDVEYVQAHYSDHLTEYTVGNQKMRFMWTGDPRNRPLIFVHGSPGSWRVWAQFLNNPDLQKRFHLIAVDRPGYGGSEGGKTEPSLHLQSEAILGVLRFNQSGKNPIIVGHSLGGPVVARMALDHPDRVGGVVFVAASVDPELEKTEWYQYPATWWPIRVLIPRDLRVCNEEIMPLKSELTEMLPKWNGFGPPVVVIQGVQDPLVPPGNFDFILSHVPANRIVLSKLVPELNHFIPWKRPDLILDGINRLEGSRL